MEPFEHQTHNLRTKSIVPFYALKSIPNQNLQVLNFMANALIYQINTGTLHIKSHINIQQHCYFSLKILFEPGSSVPEADAMSTAPRRREKPMM
jgi:hypothetical protein